MRRINLYISEYGTDKIRCNYLIKATNPLIVNNTGNFDFTKINMTAQNLTGITSPSYYIAPGNITVNVTATPSGAKMIAGSSVNISDADLLHGQPGKGNIPCTSI